MTVIKGSGENSPQLQRDTLGVALRLQQLLKLSEFMNAKIQLVILAERGRVRYLITDTNPIEPKAASLDYLLTLLGENPNDGPIHTQNITPLDQQDPVKLEALIRQIVAEMISGAA